MKLKHLLLLATSILLIYACSSDDDPFITPEPPEVNPPPVVEDPSVQIRQDATLGQVLTDEDNKTLYFFSRDIAGATTCEGGCATNWPPYFIENLKVSDDLSLSDFTTIQRPDGSAQTAYKGWPLYFFANDANAGDNNGEGVNDIWFVAKPDYSVMIANGQLVGNDGMNYTSTYEVGEGNTEYLVDPSGRTLYTFFRDEEGVNNYTEEDFSNDATWPVFTADLESIPSTYNTGDFASIDVFGRQQLTYKGWPLYYFGEDDNRGENKGVSVPQTGIWPIANSTIDPAPAPEVEPVSYSDVIQPIMNASCAFSGCHGDGSASAGISVENYDDVKVIADNGQLVGATFQEAGFSPMPRGASKLDQANLDQIKAWVDQGALNN